jgi:hypothetical protein
VHRLTSANPVHQTSQSQLYPLNRAILMVSRYFCTTYASEEYELELNYRVVQAHFLLGCIIFHDDSPLRVAGEWKCSLNEIF